MKRLYRKHTQGIINWDPRLDSFHPKLKYKAKRRLSKVVRRSVKINVGEPNENT